MNTEKVVDKIQATHGLEDKVQVASMSHLIGKSFRYERKFVYEHIELEDLIQEVCTNSFAFREIYQARRINNIYFDDGNFDFYKQNVSGVGRRLKYRLRWYGADFHLIEQPTFEIKMKFGEVGDKISYKMPDFKADLRQLSLHDIYQLISKETKNSNLLIDSKFYQLYPALYNAYERRYFMSFCNRFRITLDYHQHFYNPNFRNFSLSKSSLDEKEVILELKYLPEHDKVSREVSQQFKTRLSKNSKYVRGMELVYF